MRTVPGMTSPYAGTPFHGFMTAPTRPAVGCTATCDHSSPRRTHRRAVQFTEAVVNLKSVMDTCLPVLYSSSQ